MARELVLRDMSFLGIELDEKVNGENTKGEREISTKESRVKIFVIPTNEELVIALDTMKIVGQKK
jgi:acetate kinase